MNPIWIVGIVVLGGISWIAWLVIGDVIRKRRWLARSASADKATLKERSPQSFPARAADAQRARNDNSQHSTRKDAA